MDEIIEEITKYLNIFGIIPSDDVLHKMKEFCHVYNQDPEDIVDTWVAFISSNTKQQNMTPTLELLQQMEKEELMKKSSKPRKSQSNISAPMYNSAAIDLINDITQTPDNRRHQSVVTASPTPFSPNSISPIRATPSRKYKARASSGDVANSFGNVQSVRWKHSDEFSCHVAHYQQENILKECYLYMFEKLRECAAVLNDMIEEAALLYQRAYNIEEWGHVQLPSVENTPVVGRICSDSSGKLNAVSVLLEGSQETSAGKTVLLDLSQLEKFSFFPGQIIAGQGINSLGKKLILSSLYENTLLPFPSKPPNFSNCLDSLSIVVAAGPFTTSDTLSYEPLSDLLEYIKDHKPHACILIGPFVDMKHEEIEHGNIGETYEDFFQSLMSNLLNILGHVSTKIVLVASCRDAHHEAIYPTPPYRLRQHSKKLFLAPDPCLLEIEGVVFGITSSDILFHLGKEEIAFPPQSPDRLGRLCSHLLAQRSFYPLYPPDEEINIDYLNFEQYALLPVMPHILILPSDLRYFVKDINGCCCINPERLTKRFSGGTFARINVDCFDSEKYKGSLIDAVQAEVVRI